MGTTDLREQIAFLEQRIANYSKSLFGNPLDREGIETEKQVAEKERAQLLEKLRQQDRPADTGQ